MKMIIEHRFEGIPFDLDGYSVLYRRVDGVLRISLKYRGGVILTLVCDKSEFHFDLNEVWTKALIRALGYNDVDELIYCCSKGIKLGLDVFKHLEEQTGVPVRCWVDEKWLKFVKLNN
jgi:hypothetical protein